MEVMGFIAVLVNCALIGLSGQVHRLFPDMTAIQKVLLIVALEVKQIHLMSINTVKLYLNGLIHNICYT